MLDTGQQKNGASAKLADLAVRIYKDSHSLERARQSMHNKIPDMATTGTEEKDEHKTSHTQDSVKRFRIG